MMKIWQSITNKMFELSKTRETVEMNFLYGFRPTIYLARAVGFMPFSVIKNNIKNLEVVKVTKCDLLWFAFTIFLCSFILFLRVKNSMAHLNMPLNIMTLGDIIISIIAVASGILMIILDMCNRFKFVQIINSFTKFDAEV